MAISRRTWPGAALALVSCLAGGGCITPTVGPTPANSPVWCAHRLDQPPADAIGGAATGHDWLLEFSEYVETHKFYPKAAVDAQVEGEPVVNLVIQRSGDVKSVCLAYGSGPSILDAGLMAIFRGKQLPPFPPAFPPTSTKDEILVTMAMHYRLQPTPAPSKVRPND